MAININRFICVIFLLGLIEFGLTALSEKQIKSTGKLMRNSCQPKNKVTDETIENMHKGIWDDDKPAKCYMHCVLATMKLIKKNGELDMDSAMKQMVSLPDTRREGSIKSLEACKNEGDPTDKCNAAWKISRCIYMDNPENYILP